MSGIRYRQFLAGSIAGDLPVVILYAAAGSRIADLARPGDALTLNTVLLLTGAGAALLVSLLLKNRKAAV